MAVRASVGWAAMLLFLLLTRGVGALRIARDLLFLVPLGLVGVGAFYLLYFFTVRESTVGTAAVLLYSSPAFVVLLARAFLKETLGLLRVLALGLTFGGIFLVVGGYALSALEVSPLVFATGLLSGLTYGLYSIFGNPVASRLEPAVILSYALGIGSVLLMLAVIHTALAFGLYTAGLRSLDAGQAAIVATVEPVVAGAAGIALLGEELTAPKLAGAVLVLAGAALAQVRLRKASR